MELISWSLSAIDKVFSQRNGTVGPDGTYAAGYSLDSWNKWKVVCLAVLSVEDIEDIYLIGLMIAGYLLTSVGFALVYRKVCKLAAKKETPLLSVEIKEHFGKVSEHLMELQRNLAKSEELFKALSARYEEGLRKMDYNLSRSGEMFREVAGQISGLCRAVDGLRPVPDANV